MRHIPEDELHAYLDQALSRSQCVEIESHLASCDVCRGERDGIAALRDRTTALLATLAPSRRIPPSLDVLRTRQAVRAARRQHRMRNAAWAASLLAALGAGWYSSFLRYGPATPSSRIAPIPAPAAAMPLATSAPAGEAPAEPASTAGGMPAAGASASARPASRPTVATATAGRSPRAAHGGPPVLAIEPTLAATTPARRSGLSRGAIEVSSSALPDSGDLVLAGMWRTVSLDGARDEAGELPPRIDGLPVMQVQVQKGSTGQKPLMVVAQQLQSGQMIRTIEGPAADVSSLLANRSDNGAPSPWPTLQVGGNASAIQSRDGAMALRYGDRILAITAPLPSDSLLAMIRRLNAELRTK